MSESGYVTYDVLSWNAMFAPAGTSLGIINKLNSELTKVIQLPDIKEKLSNLGLEATTTTPDHLTNLIKSEMEKWDRVIKASGISIE